jgi:hypothetical protein
MVTYGGKTPVELVFGRPPRDVVTIENSSPELLTTPVTTREVADQTLQHMALNSYVEARQNADLKKDIATRLLPSERHVAPRD